MQMPPQDADVGSQKIWRRPRMVALAICSVPFSGNSTTPAGCPSAKQDGLVLEALDAPSFQQRGPGGGRAVSKDRICSFDDDDVALMRHTTSSKGPLCPSFVYHITY